MRGQNFWNWSEMGRAVPKGVWGTVGGGVTPPQFFTLRGPEAGRGKAPIAAREHPRHPYPTESPCSLPRKGPFIAGGSHFPVDKGPFTIRDYPCYQRSPYSKLLESLIDFRGLHRYRRVSPLQQAPLAARDPFAATGPPRYCRAPLLLMGLNSLQQALLTLKGPLALGGAFRYLWNHIAVRGPPGYQRAPRC